MDIKGKMKQSVPFEISELHYLFHPRFNSAKSKKLLNFDSQKDEPSKKSRKPRLIVRPRKFPKIKDPTEVVCSKRQTGDLLDQLIADKITNEILERQNALQKMKDKDTLRAWRDKYKIEKSRGEAPIFVKNPPPFGIDENLLSMTSRQELTANNSKRDEIKRERRAEKDINEEIVKLKKLMDSLKTSERFAADEPERNMASALREMKTIKRIQKQIEILKKRC